jgi:hypothetical protein
MRTIAGLLLAICCGLAVGAEAPPSTPGKVRSPSLVDSHPDLSKYIPSKGRYALVFVQVQVDERGKVREARLADGGYHDKESEQAALALAREIRLRPATLDGKPVTWNGIFPVRFSAANVSGSTRAVSVEFRNEANKVQAFLQKKDFASAQFHAQWMLSEKVGNDYEYAILQTTLADSFARNSSVHRALAVIRDVTRRSTFRVEEYEPGGALPEVTVNDFALRRTPFELEHLLRLRFIVAESQGLYLDALRAHADLQALGFVKSDDPTMGRFRDLLQKVKDAPEFTGHVRMDEKSTWPHALLHNHFRLSNIRGGRIEEVVLNCPGYTRSVAYILDDDIRIPNEWRGCNAVFKGTLGTEFDIVEFRDAAVAKPVTIGN